MFDKLNKYYVTVKQQPETGEVCMTNFKTNYYEIIKVELLDSVQKQITRDRLGEIIKKELVKEALQSYIDMGLGKA